MPEMPPFSPTVALLTFSRVWDQALTDALKPLGLTTRKYGLLGHIGRTPGISFSELARRSRITVQSVHVAVAAFAADGWVQDASGRAGAASRLEVTDAGILLLAEAASKIVQLDAAFTAAHPGLAEALRIQMKQVMTPEP
jgi:DNA-binding MarR family transcriptional regulator